MQASKEADAERRAQKASEAAEEAKQKAEEAARQVSEGRARTSHLERAQEALITERDRALKEVCLPCSSLSHTLHSSLQPLNLVRCML